MPLPDLVLHPFAAPSATLDAPLCLAAHRGTTNNQAGWLGEEVDDLRAHGLRVRLTSSALETRDALSASPHRAVVLDPLGSGPTELADILATAQDCPVLLAVDTPAQAALIAAVEAEMARTDALVDLVPRGAGADELLLRLRALERAAAWRHRASHDERTECLRPEAFEVRLAETDSAARRHGFALALALLDLDDFGQVNKQHDHTIGDRVIARAGEVLRGTLRAEDLAGRVGGDEFALALPFTDRAEARRCTQRVLTELGRAPIPGRDGREVFITASAGIAVVEAGDAVPLEVVRRRAESALRLAKERGGNTAVAWIDQSAEETLAVAE